MVETLRLGDRLTLRTPDGGSLTLANVCARLEREGLRIVDVWIRAELAPLDWTRVDTHAWFHLEPAVRGPTFGGPFAPDARVQLEARLDPALATALAVLSGNEWALLAELRGAGLLPRLHDTESWYALYVTQACGPVRGGFRTGHADALP